MTRVGLLFSEPYENEEVIEPYYQGDWTAESGYHLVSKLLSDSWGKFSAVLAGSDLMALGAMRALYEHGVLIPDEVSIAGFTDLAASAFFQPPLTTVRRQDFAQFGQLGVECFVSDRSSEQLRPAASLAASPDRSLAYRQIAAVR